MVLLLLVEMGDMEEEEEEAGDDADADVDITGNKEYNADADGTDNFDFWDAVIDGDGNGDDIVDDTPYKYGSDDDVISRGRRVNNVLSPSQAPPPFSPASCRRMNVRKARCWNEKALITEGRPAEAESKIDEKEKDE
ncbi:hypothetical protein RRG08_030091 [Elysia crispata]|uniref:Uncharacterized protein n=1 Tax=Elysia crispata TaxID=231223 RepID=A0AAE0ZR14_9GAST|nr:hypothetical protein RRG08_030091 [Elysia crispata]